MLGGSCDNLNEKLSKKSLELTDVICKVAMDNDYIVRAELHLDKLRPLEKEDIPSSTFCFDKIIDDPAGFYSYEDAGMTTGIFLASQSIRYKLTNNSNALHNANNAFTGIEKIYELGKQETEGFFPKPYGKKTSKEISRDQYLYVLEGLREYHEIAGDAKQKKIKEMARNLGRYWVNINYSHPYLGLSKNEHLSDFMGSLFLGIIGTAYQISKDAFLLKEYKRLLQEHNLGKRMPETLRSQFLNGKKYDGGMYFRSHQHCMSMKTLAVEMLWDYDLDNRPLWKKSLRAFWEDDLLVGFDPADGLCYGIVGFNPADNNTYLTNPGVIKELENPLNISHLTWGGRRKTAMSTQLAFSAIFIADRLGDNEALEIANAILEKVELEKCSEYIIADQEDLPPGEEYRVNLLNVCYLCSWLWAYWLARKKKLLFTAIN